MIFKAKFMQAVQLIQYGGSEALTVNEIATPTIAEGKIMVQVHAAGVNPFDWKLRAGFFEKMIALTLPVTLGGDFSGVVTAVGADVAEYHPGDEVYGQAMVLNGGSGSFAEFDLADVKTVARKPKNLSHIEAAALPLAGVSAWQALVDTMHLSAGQRILIHGGGGGIGALAIQIAKQLGATVATTVSARHRSYVQELDVDTIIDYTQQKFEEVVNNYDAVFDTVGGDTYTRSFQVLKPGGMIVSMLEQPNQDLMKHYGVQAVAQNTHVTAERLTKLTELVEQGALKVHVEKIFPLVETAAALAFVEHEHPTGKVVVQIK